MNILDRIQLALQTPLGGLLIGLVIFLIILGVAYWILIIRQRSKDILAYLYRSHYERAERQAKGLRFNEIHKADLFGRQSVVQMENGSYGLCLIPPPELSKEKVRERFHYCSQTLCNSAPSIIAPYIWKYDADVWILVQGGIIQSNGRTLSSLKSHLKDQRLKEIDRERILLELARTLNFLHGLDTEVGENLYHGFLLPTTLFLDFDRQQNISRLVLADTGIAFSLQPLQVFRQLSALREGKLAIDKFRANELLEYIPMLAPEQRELPRLHEVNHTSDYYSFGSLAVLIFTDQKIRNLHEINWSAIPHKWHPFLKSCLQNDPKRRPKSFEELNDWLTDPELALTHPEMNDFLVHPAAQKSTSEMEVEMESLTEIVSRLRANRTSVNPVEKQGQKKLWEHIDNGLKAVKLSRWDAAKKHFKEAIKVDPNSPEAHINYAIACYETKDLKTAEKHYELAKKYDPRAAKKFREHIALRI